MKNRKLLKQAAGLVAAAMIVNGIPWKMKGEKQFENTCIVADAAHYITGSYYYKQLQQGLQYRQISKD